MILRRGNMWDCFGKVDLFLITTNPVVNAKGELVMGRGIALEAKKRFPELPKDFAEAHAKAVHTQGYDDALHPVNVGNVRKWYDGQLVGWFMVKNHWAENARLDIIEHSVRELSKLCKAFNYKGWDRVRDLTVALNFPGIGNGKLKREEVLPLIEQLPDNVHVWEYGD